MIKPPQPLDETARLVSLHSLRVLDSQPDERFDRITRIVRQVFEVDICLISLVDKDRQWFKSRQGLAACQTSREISFCGHAILSDEILVVPDATEDERFHDNPLVIEDPKIRFYAGCPLHGPRGFRIGTLCIIHREARDLSQREHVLLREFAGLIEEGLGILSRSMIDGLTALSNRNGFNAVARQVLALCERTNTSAELLYFDLNGFKQINDTRGHAEGDLMLVRFATLLTKCFRSADVIARLGGDEFVVLMTDCEDANVALSRLEQLARHERRFDDPLDWSVGRATFDPARHDTLQSLIGEADAQMYADKSRRRAAR